MEKEMRSKAKADIIEMCEREIGRDLIMIDFYNSVVAETKDKKDKANIELGKIEPIKKALTFNRKLLESVKSM